MSVRWTGLRKHLKLSQICPIGDTFSRRIDNPTDFCRDISSGSFRAFKREALRSCLFFNGLHNVSSNRCHAVGLFGGKLRGRFFYSVAGFTEVVSFDLSCRQSCCNAGSNSDSDGAQRQWLSLEEIR